MLRSKRANAGNRLQSLLDGNVPLDAEDAEFFAEHEDDEDFDLEAEEQRLKEARRLEQERAKEENSGDDEDSDDSNVNNDDYFTDTDDSDIENDHEPIDAGEKQLQAEQRQRTKEKRISERNKMFKIKVRPERPEGEAKPKKAKPSITPGQLADQLEARMRRNERRSALKNKQHLIEQIREAEERRAQYVPPKRKRVKRITQEERLEEAKKTELRNLSSLNKFVELEEERRIQQRLAMLSRRPKLTNVVRYSSSSIYEHPYIEEIKVEEEDYQMQMQYQMYQMPVYQMPQIPNSSIQPPSVMETNVKTEELGTQGESVEKKDFEGKSEVSVVQTPTDSNTHDPPKDGIANLNDETKGDEVKGDESKGDDSKGDDSKGDDSKGNETNESKEVSGDPNSKDIINDIGNTDSNDKDTSLIELPKEEVKMEVKQEDPNVPLIEGPDRLAVFNCLTLHNFETPVNKFATRGIILGPIASNAKPIPPKRMCPFTGTVARYVDPSTNIGYTDLKTNEMIRLARSDQLGWCKEMGGVLTRNGKPPRHAKGVPAAFYEDAL